jgi:glycosyltransferase involved in cell wall biosynthesis
MPGARALLSPSLLYGGQPPAVLEALTAGLPVFVSRTEGNVELLGRVGERWLIHLGDPALCTCASNALDDRAVNDTGEGARRLHEGAFIEHRAPRLLEHAYWAAHAGKG